MSSTLVTVAEAATRLHELLCLAEQGEEVVITDTNHLKVKLVPLRPEATKRIFGQHRGQIWIHPDFDAPLPDTFWLSGTP